MAERILLHKKSRPKEWTTIEEPMDVAAGIAAASGHDVVIVDCLTLFLSNLICEDARANDPDGILDEIDKLLNAARIFKGTVIVISNEVGMGIVPENELARKFRDLAGRANQMMADAADEVYACFSGIPVQLKGIDAEKGDLLKE